MRSNSDRQRPSQIADLAAQLGPEGVQVRAGGRGAALLGSPGPEVLDLAFELAHPVQQRVALARAGRLGLGLSQLLAQVRQLLGMPAQLLTQPVDRVPFVRQELTEPGRLVQARQAILGGARPGQIGPVHNRQRRRAAAGAGRRGARC